MDKLHLPWYGIAPSCHPERSEGSLALGVEMLRCAQHDSAVLPIPPRHPEQSALLFHDIFALIHCQAQPVAAFSVLRAT